MARRFTESFEGAHLFRFGQAPNVVIQDQADMNLVAPTIPLVPDGTYCAFMASQTIYASIHSQYIDNNENYMGFYFITWGITEPFEGFGRSGRDTTHRLVEWRTNSGTTLGYIRTNPDTQFLEYKDGSDVLQATSTQEQPLTDLTLYHLQVHMLMDGSNGQVQVKLDDKLVIDFTGNTGSPNSIDQIWLRGPGLVVADTTIATGHWFDDVVINDITPDSCGANSQDSWPGVRRFQVMQVASPGTYAQFTSSTGDDNYLNVDDIPNDGDATTNYALTTGLKDSFPVEPNGLDATQITYQALFQEVIARKTSGTIKIKLGVRRAGTDYMESSSHDVGVSYDVYDNRLCQDPSSLDFWTSAGIDATELIYQSST